MRARSDQLTSVWLGRYVNELNDTSDLSSVLAEARDGDLAARDKFFSVVFSELQVLARSIMLNGAPGQILVTGGGAHHGFLLKRWSAHLGNEWKLDVPSALWIDGKEAAAFAWLAQRTALGKTTSLASVTGATRDVCGGVLFGNFAAPGMNGK